MEFKATTEEYTPPMAVININIDNPSMISFVRPEGSPTIYTLNEGDNEVKMNLDKGKKLTLSFKTSYQDKFIVAADNKVLELIDDWYTLSAEVEYSEAGNYSVLARTIKEGDYDGNISCTSASEYKVWTVTFEPCEIMEVAEDMQPYITNSESEENTTAKSVEISGNSAVITFEETPADGAHTFMIPAGTFKINGQAVPEFSLDFDITPSGIGSLQQENGSVARYFNLQGIEIDNPEAGQTVIVVKDGKTHKAIINR